MIADIKFYVSLLLRRLHYFLIIMIAVASVGLTMAYTLPPTYMAQAKLLVESAQIPDKLAASTVESESSEMLQIIQQRLLTRNNLIDLARRFKTIKSGSEKDPDAIVNDMKKRIVVSLPGRKDSAPFLSVSFKAPTAATSAAVTNELVTQILQESVELRTSVAGQTLEFFRLEVARLDTELALQGEKILQFKLKNQGALPDSTDFRRSQLVSLQERLLLSERELSGLRDRRDRLVTLFETTGVLDLSGEDMTPDQKRLAELQSELSSALVIYSEKNPRVVALQTQIESMEIKISGSSALQSPGEKQPSAYELQLADLDGQITYIDQQTGAVEAEIVVLKASIEATPANAVALGTLERDYENTRVQYNQATADFAAARTGDQIEAQARGQRITVIEQAVAPSVPTSPDRPKIAAVSIGAGMMLGGGFVALLELLNGAIRRPSEISTRLGITPFATIPYIRTRRQRTRRRFIITGAFLFVAVGIPVMLFVLHVYYLPMDLLVELALEKSGVSGLLERFR